MTPSHPLAANHAAIRARIAAAAARAGRDAAHITLVAVTKNHAIERVRELLAAGAADLGENRIQEAQEKFTPLRAERDAAGLATPRLHLIGHLQTNKAKYVVRLFDLVHSVDSLRVAEALDEACARAGRERIEILLQANVSGEESKFGVAPGDLEALLRAVAPLPRVVPVGLMTMAPYEYEPEQTRPVFRGLREARNRLAALGVVSGATAAPLTLPHLSMGMTNDFEVAIEEGATLVRVGTALFEGVEG